jgi:hypothetical protein
MVLKKTLKYNFWNYSIIYVDVYAFEVLKFIFLGYDKHSNWEQHGGNMFEFRVDDKYSHIAPNNPRLQKRS